MHVTRTIRRGPPPRRPAARGTRTTRSGLALGPLALLLALACASPAEVDEVRSGSTVAVGITLRGAGASFPYPAYSHWSHRYYETSGVSLSYHQSGSAAGIEAVRAGRVDFGASDSPLSDDELRDSGLLQFPSVIGGVVPVVHLPGIEPGALRLDGSTLADIFRGAVTRWDDEAIRALNPDLALPARDIVPIHRADASGTSQMFTSYLDAVSPAWRREVGSGLTVAWPVGVGAEGNDQVARFVDQFRDTIGYVQFALAVQNNLAWVTLQNHDGVFVEPSWSAFEAAAEQAEWSADGLRLPMLDQPGSEAWPITGASYVLMRQAVDAERAAATIAFFRWAYRDGAELARELQYVPIPANHHRAIEAIWARETASPDQPRPGDDDDSADPRARDQRADPPASDDR